MDRLRYGWFRVRPSAKYPSEACENIHDKWQLQSLTRLLLARQAVQCKCEPLGYASAQTPFHATKASWAVHLRAATLSPQTTDDSTGNYFAHQGREILSTSSYSFRVKTLRVS